MKFDLIRPVILAGVLGATACGGSGSGGDSLSSASSSALSSSTSSASSSSLSSSSASSWAVSEEHLYDNASFPVGVAVSAGNESYSLLEESGQGQKRRDAVIAHFSNMTPGNIMKMSYLHPEENTYTFADADALVQFAADHGKTLHGHTLVWHSDYQVPGWMKNYSGDWQAMLSEHVTNIVGHFASGEVVTSWDVVNEAFAEDGSYRSADSVFYQNMGESYLEVAFRAARNADPAADLYYNDYNLAQGGAKLNAVIAMAEDFMARGVPIDGIGFQGHIQIDWPAASVMEQSFAQAAATGLKVRLTELDIPINNPYSASYSYPDNYHAELTQALADRQKRRYCEVVTAYLNGVPEAQRGGITVWGIEDPSSWLISQLFANKHDDWPLLFDKNLNPKPALQGVADALNGQACE